MIKTVRHCTQKYDIHNYMSNEAKVILGICLVKCDTLVGFEDQK